MHAVLTLEPGGECRRRPRRGAPSGRPASGCRAGRGTRRTARSSPPVSIWTASTSSTSSRPTGDDAGDDVAVAAEELRRRLDDEVRAELERPADVRRGERVVDDVGRAVLVGEPRRPSRGRSRRSSGWRWSRRTRPGSARGDGARGGRVVGHVDEVDPDAEPREGARRAASAWSRRRPAARRPGRRPSSCDASAAWIAPMPDASACPASAAGELGVGVARARGWSGWRGASRRSRPADRQTTSPSSSASAEVNVAVW